MSVQNPFLTIAQAAERMVVAPGKILGWIASGELAAVDISAARNQRPRWRIDPSEWDRFVTSRMSTPRIAKPTKANRPKQKVTQYIT